MRHKARVAIAVLALASVLLVLVAGADAQDVATIAETTPDEMIPGEEYAVTAEVNNSLGITALWFDYTMVGEDGYSRTGNVSMTDNGTAFTYDLDIWENATWLNYTISGSDNSGAWHTVNQSLEAKEQDEALTGAYLAMIGAGLAVGIAGMGAGIGVGIAGAAGAGVVAEKPEKFGTAIVFQALPQTQAIYGLLIAILILLGTGLLGGEARNVPVSAGLVAIGCGLAVGIAGLSAIGQGIAASAGVGAASEKPEMFGKGIVFSVLPETQAIYGLLVAILLMAFSGMFVQDFNVSLNQSIAALGAGLAIGIAGLSAIGQGITGSAAIAATSRNPEAMGKGLIFSVMSETFAIFGLLIAILIMRYTGLM